MRFRVGALTMSTTGRRAFLQWVLGGVVSLPGIGPLVGCFWPRRLDASERAVLVAASSRILPSDGGPGAREAGVIEYIARALAGRYHAGLRPLFSEGVRRLNRMARAGWRRPFVDLEPEEQDRILLHFEVGRANEAAFDGSEFFHRLLELTLEGFLGDPVHGGNAGEVGWRSLGLSLGGPRPGPCRRHG